MTVHWDDLGSSTMFLQSCPKIQSDDSFRRVLLSPPASQPPGPDRDAAWRNLFVTESCPQRVTSSPFVTMHFERWCNPAPSVILCHIPWTPRCVFYRTLYARCEHAQFHTLMSTPAHSNCYVLASRELERQHDVWNMETCYFVHLDEKTHSSHFVTPFMLSHPSGSSSLPVHFARSNGRKQHLHPLGEFFFLVLWHTKKQLLAVKYLFSSVDKN